MNVIDKSILTIQQELHDLSQPLSPKKMAWPWSYFYRPSHSPTPLWQLSIKLKECLSQMIPQAALEQDMKIKEAVCQRLIQLDQSLQSISRTCSLPSEESRLLSEMNQEVHNALISHDDRIWGTRFCPAQVFSDSDWEACMQRSYLLPVEQVSFVKYYLFYVLSLVWTQLISLITPQQWYNKIMEQEHPKKASLYLGALPLSTPFKNDLEAITKEGVSVVLSMVERFENHHRVGLSSPITPSEWKRAGIQQLQIPMEDFRTGPIADVERGVEFIRWNLQRGKSVYVHCKAGRGRSALIVMAYLIKYEHMSVQEAFACVRSHRSQAGFSAKGPKMQTLLEYEKRVNLLGK